MASQTYTVLGICCIVTVQALDVAIAVKVYRSSGEAWNSELFEATGFSTKDYLKNGRP